MAKKDTKKRRRKLVLVAVPKNCPFCKSKTEPDYKQYDALEKYVSDRSKIYGKSRTGICAKHQRRISLSVKRARHLGLLPYVPSLD